jgi:Type III restriction enzyme, res subunit/Helicase C-terminal domain
MVDFNALISTKKEITEFDLDRFYASLDVKSSHTEPRPAQKEAFVEITKEHKKKDLVLKINTGSGKTTIGLLFAYAHMRLAKRPVAYLCTTVQLCKQVLEEATRLGISAKEYPAGQSQPDFQTVRGESIIVCTYEKLFNAKTTFNRGDVNIVPYAIVLDDAHAGVESVRKQFTLPVVEDAFVALKKVLAVRCSQYHQTRWREIEEGEPSAYLEVPHWIWSEVATEAATELDRFDTSGAFPFVWPYLKDALQLCRCVISGAGAEIAPEVLPVNNIRPFASCQHRLFMSATLSDDSVLVRELGVDPNSAIEAIAPKSDRGLGERMVIAPSLIHPKLDRKYVMSLSAELSKSANVVVLASSEEHAREWEKVGAKTYLGDSFSDGISSLKRKDSGIRFVVLVQRYDGVDLPDDACRVLVIDGKPKGEGLIDRVDTGMTHNAGGVRNKAIFRIEQGMGRAVRTHADYAVVFLVGDELSTFIGRNEVLQSMTQDTRSQIELGFELIRHVERDTESVAEAEIRQLVSKCLGRDEGWKAFYSQRVRSVAKQIGEPDKARIALARSERYAYELASMNQFNDGFQELNTALAGNFLNDDEKAVYLQRLSRLNYFVDRVEAMKVQVSARKLSKAVALPPNVVVSTPKPGTNQHAHAVTAWILSFNKINAAVLELCSIRDRLNFSNKPKIVEEAVYLLGVALGAMASRPEDDYRRGPDDLWLWGENAYVIEVKSQVERTLSKADSGQLHDSCAWAKETYPEWGERIIPIVVTNASEISSDAHFPDRTMRIGDQQLVEIVNAHIEMCNVFAKQGPIVVNYDTVLSELTKRGLLPTQFHKCCRA